MEIRWLEDALADITEIYLYIAADNPRVAARVVERIQAAIRSLAELPHRGRPGRWPRTRELIIPGTPCIVPYRVQGNRLEVLRLFHGAGRWPEEPVESARSLRRGQPAARDRAGMTHGRWWRGP